MPAGRLGCQVFTVLRVQAMQGRGSLPPRVWHRHVFAAKHAWAVQRRNFPSSRLWLRRVFAFVFRISMPWDDVPARGFRAAIGVSFWPLSGALAAEAIPAWRLPTTCGVGKRMAPVGKSTGAARERSRPRSQGGRAAYEGRRRCLVRRSGFGGEGRPAVRFRCPAR